MNTTIFKYQNNEISFENSDRSIMINATEMARSFGKRPVDWLENQNTQEFLTELSKVRKSTLADLVVVKKGGNNSGMWMHEDVALEFSRWLSQFGVMTELGVIKIWRHNVHRNVFVFVTANGMSVWVRKNLSSASLSCIRT